MVWILNQFHFITLDLEIVSVGLNHAVDHHIVADFDVGFRRGSEQYWRNGTGSVVQAEDEGAGSIGGDKINDAAGASDEARPSAQAVYRVVNQISEFFQVVLSYQTFLYPGRQLDIRFNIPEQKFGKFWKKLDLIFSLYIFQNFTERVIYYMVKKNIKINSFINKNYHHKRFPRKNKSDFRHYFVN